MELTSLNTFFILEFTKLKAKKEEPICNLHGLDVWRAYYDSSSGDSGVILDKVIKDISSEYVLASANMSSNETLDVSTFIFEDEQYKAFVLKKLGSVIIIDIVSCNDTFDTNHKKHKYYDGRLVVSLSAFVHSGIFQTDTYYFNNFKNDKTDSLYKFLNLEKYNPASYKFNVGTNPHELLPIK